MRRIAFKLALICAVAALSMAPTAWAHAEKRVALVIGNNDYKFVPKLQKAVNDALAAANTAQTAFDTADAGSKSLRQAGLAAAQTALARAQAAQESALEQARAALINGDGTTRLDNIMGQPVEKDYVSAIINAMAATGDVAAA